MTLELAKTAINIGLVTSRPVEMLAFYEGTLGLHLDATWAFDEYSIDRLRCGDSVISLYSRPSLPAKRSGPPGAFNGDTGYRWITIVVQNLEDAVQRCADDGAEIAVPITNTPANTTVAMVVDPDGNWVELALAGPGH